MKVLFEFRDGDILVDDDVYESLKDLPWSVMHGVPRRHVSKYPPKSEQLNRRLMNATGTDVVFHIDGDKYNCQRSNMAVLSRAAWTQRNKQVGQLGYRGVSLCKGQYLAKINTEDGAKHLGKFDTPEQAARAYDEAAAQMYGEHALLNFGADK